MGKDNKYLVKFNKPYTFEGGEYTEVDLSGIETMTVKDLADAERQFTIQGNVAAMNEMSISYACIIASMASKKPDTFFTGLPANEGVKIKNLVMGFFFE
jgi:hypothetical protein